MREEEGNQTEKEEFKSNKQEQWPVLISPLTCTLFCTLFFLSLFPCSLFFDVVVVVVVVGSSRKLGGRVNAGSNDAFLVMFSSNGELQWTQLLGAANYEDSLSVAVDQRGGTAFVAGYTSASLGGQSNLGSFDLFLVRYDYGCGVGLVGNGTGCSNINECALGLHSCQSGSAQCTDTIGSFLCTCNAGFTGSGTSCLPVPVIDTWSYTRQLGSPESDDYISVDTDAQGRVFLAASANGPTDGNAAAGGRDVFVAHFRAADGQLLWSRQFGSSGTDLARAIATNGAGVSFVVGETNGVLDRQPLSGDYDMFLTRYDADGSRAWTRLLGTTAFDGGRAVAVDLATGTDIFVCGSTAQTTSGLPGTAGLGGSSDAFLARYHSNGTRVWVRQTGTAAGEICYGVAVHASQIYITGSTDGNMIGFSNRGGDDFFIQRFTPQGSVAWTIQSGSAGNDYGFGIAVGGQGVHIVGWTNGPLHAQTALGGIDAFVSKYTLTGSASSVWTRLLGTAQSDMAFGIDVDSDGNVFIAGYTGGALSGQPFAGNDDAFVAQYSSSGARQWTRTRGTDGFDYADAVAIDNAGGILLAGTTSGSMDGRPNRGRGQDVLFTRLQYTCVAGFVNVSFVCVDQDECAARTHSCSSSSSSELCVNSVGSFSCQQQTDFDDQ